MVGSSFREFTVSSSSNVFGGGSSSVFRNAFWASSPRHSPIRYLTYSFFLEEIPSWVSVHLVRHIHAQPYVKSQRNDRQGEYDRTKAPQDAPVNMIWDVNAEELMVIANKRLCMQASPETRKVVREMCDLAQKHTPELEGLLVPMCEYQNGVCHEMKSCGRYSPA